MRGRVHPGGAGLAGYMDRRRRPRPDPQRDRETVLGLGADLFVDLQADRLEDTGQAGVVFDVIGGEAFAADRRLPGKTIIQVTQGG